jgi:hypothetical protein
VTVVQGWPRNRIRTVGGPSVHRMVGTHADHLARCAGHRVRLSPSTTTRISPSDRLHPTAPQQSAPTAHRTAGRSRSLRSLVALEAALGPGPPDLAHHKVASRFEARSAEWDNIDPVGAM